MDMEPLTSEVTVTQLFQKASEYIQTRKYSDLLRLVKVFLSFRGIFVYRVYEVILRPNNIVIYTTNLEITVDAMGNIYVRSLR